MKICAISPLCSTSESEILEFISGCEHNLVVLPGNAENHPNYQSVAEILKLKHEVFVFVESGSGKGESTPWLVSPTQQIKMPSQIFGTNPTAGDLDRLQGIWAKRTHEIGNRKVSFAICGEIDAFAKDGSVKRERQLEYDILVNPTHTTRGRWNHLGEKLSNLSIGTAVIHVANNDYDHHKVTTDVRIYVNGKIMKRQVSVSGGIAWSECEI